LHAAASIETGMFERRDVARMRVQRAGESPKARQVVVEELRPREVQGGGFGSPDHRKSMKGRDVALLSWNHIRRRDFGGGTRTRQVAVTSSINMSPQQMRRSLHRVCSALGTE
jgi:hypothetical protein